MRTLPGVGPGVWLRRGGVTPLSIFGTRLGLWLDVHQRGVIGTGYSAVSDRSRNANNATQGTGSLQPSRVAAQAGGRDVARFDGADDYLTVANAASLRPSATGFTTFVVMKRRAAPFGDYPQVLGSRPWTAVKDHGWALALGGAASTGLLSIHYADGAAGFDVVEGLAATQVSTSAFEVWITVVDRVGGTVKHYRNGTLDVTRTPAQQPAGALTQTDALNVGREIGGSNNRRLNADVADLGFIVGIPTAAELAALSRCLMVRNGVA